MSELKYNAGIHRRAIDLISAKKRLEKYKKDCLRGGICAKCGIEGHDIDSKEIESGGVVFEFTCKACGYVNRGKINEED